VHQLDEKTNETHNQKADANCPSNLYELFAIGFGALLHQMHGVLGELLERFDQNLLESFFIRHVYLFWNVRVEGNKRMSKDIVRK
jgi:hypothetical protein